MNKQVREQNITLAQWVKNEHQEKRYFTPALKPPQGTRDELEERKKKEK